MANRVACMACVTAVLGAPLWTPPVLAAAAERPTLKGAAGRALAFFERVDLGSHGDLLERLRPTVVSAAFRAQVIATLPKEGEVRPSPGQAAKLAAVEPVLAYHQRQGVIELKLITVGHAFVGLHARTVLLVSREALDQVNVRELQALAAHEMGHEYFWDEYAQAMAARDHGRLRELELRCDGVALLTLHALGLGGDDLIAAVKRLTLFNERLGAVASAGAYVSVGERARFIETMDRFWSGRAVGNR
jgi:hypothetical protein